MDSIPVDDHRRRPRQAWTGAADARLVALKRQGLGWRAIGRALARTTSACIARYARLCGSRVRPVPAPVRRTRRRCLACGRTFASTHPGNRLCAPCGETAADWPDGVAGTSVGMVDDRAGFAEPWPAEPGRP